jgi:hypothetical protein
MSTSQLVDHPEQMGRGIFKIRAGSAGMGQPPLPDSLVRILPLFDFVY